jgi:SAM-dependent methyltransferase
LVQHFERVVATDASAAQLANTISHERIEYHVEPAEAVSLDDGSVDLVTVAIAVHWFDFDRFYREVRRVLRADGILAVWTYHLPAVDPRVDPLLMTYYREVLWDYWPERIRYVDERYQTLPFPFDEIHAPAFEIEATWTLGQLVGFLDSWSAARKYEAKHGYPPLKEVWEQLADAWGEPDQRRVIRWPLFLRVGRR